jgi:hypothetical protein
MLSDKIVTIQENISKLKDITGFKSLMKEHEKINKDILECKQTIEELVKHLDMSESEIKLDLNILDINDNEFEENISFLREFDFDSNTNIEDQINMYMQIMAKISIMENYITKRKLEIVKL